jgi:hypothetical protein
MGHVFQAGDLICECGWDWFAHQESPRDCRRAVKQVVIDAQALTAKLGVPI